MMQRSAVISECGRYRYKLKRTWHPGMPEMMFLMLNPSTADHNVDDRTIRRCIDFAQRWGYGAFWVGNLFAFRSPYPEDLLRVADPVGESNDEALMEMADVSELIVAGWGAHGVHNGRDAAVKSMLTGRLHALKMTKEGHPWHPLYLPKTTTPFLWTEDET